MSALYLCRPGGDIIGTMSGLDDNSVKHKRQIGSPWDLSFEVYRYELNNTVNPGETTYYHSISDGMELLLESTDFSARFRISEEPAVNTDGIAEKKSVVAKSIECELQNKMLKLFNINTGKPESLENLVKGNLREEKVDSTDTTQAVYNYNYNPYTNLPIEYIITYNNMKDKIREDFVFTSNSVYWKEQDITINYSVDQYGTVTATDPTQQDLLVECIDAFINEFPRIQQDIRWVIDDDNLQKQISPPDDKVVCVIESYIEVVRIQNSVTINLVPPKYIYTLDTDGWHISEVENYQFSSQRLLDGVNRVKDYFDKFGDQLSLLDLAIESVKVAGWSIGDVPDEVASRKYSFSIDSQDIYSFLTDKCANAMKVIFDFDRYNKKVNVINVSEDDEEHDTGVIIGFHNLMNSIDIKTASDDGIKTKFNVSGANNLGISYVNFGSDSIINLDYFMSKIDEYGNHQFVSDTLYNKYQAWKAYRYTEQITVTDVPDYEFNERTKTYTKDTTTTITGTRSEVYQKLSEKYNQSVLDIDRIINMLPNDGVRVDYMTYNYDDLKVAWTAYNNAFNALIALYKEDYYADVIVPSSPWLRIEQRVEEADIKGYKYLPNGELEEVTSIKDTFYWHDFAGYYYNIIPNVLAALKRFIKTNANMEVLNEDDVVIDVIDPDGERSWVYIETGNPYYNSDEDKVEHLSVEAYKYDMSLYGRDELQILKKSWIGAATQIFKDGFVKTGTTIDNYTYNTWADIQALPDSDPRKKEFSNQSDYESKLSDYLDYASRIPRVNKLVNRGRYGKANESFATAPLEPGVIYMAQAEIEKCELLLSDLEDKQQTLYEMRDEIADAVTLEQWGQFTSKELGVINSLISEADYSNNNIVTTNLDTLGESKSGEETVVSIQQTLLEDAEKKLFEKSRPQYSFTADIDNLLILPEFQALSSSVQLLNYIYLRIGLYDNETVRLRIVSIENNPLIPTEELTLEFSNMMYTYDGLSDLIRLFSDETGGGSSGSSSSGGSGGTYGTNDAEITISNNMLNALLKNRDYIGSVNSTILQTQKIITDQLNAGKVVVGGISPDDMATKSGLATSNYTEIDGGNIKTNSLNANRIQTGTLSADYINGGTIDASDVTIENLNASNIVTGMLQSADTNHLSWINLDLNKFHFGGNNGYIDWNGNKLSLKGELEQDGDLTINGIPIVGKDITSSVDLSQLSYSASRFRVFRSPMFIYIVGSAEPNFNPIPDPNQYSSFALISNLPKPKVSQNVIIYFQDSNTEYSDSSIGVYDAFINTDKSLYISQQKAYHILDRDSTMIFNIIYCIT